MLHFGPTSPKMPPVPGVRRDRSAASVAAAVLERRDVPMARGEIVDAARALALSSGLPVPAVGSIGAALSRARRFVPVGRGRGGLRAWRATGFPHGKAGPAGRKGGRMETVERSRGR